MPYGIITKIFWWIVDRLPVGELLARVVSKFIPPIKICPNKIKFTSSLEWKQKSHFFVINDSPFQPYFNVYIEVSGDEFLVKNLIIQILEKDDNLSAKVGPTTMSYQVVRANCLVNGKERVLLVLSQLPPRSYMSFSVEYGREGNLNIRLLRYNQEPSTILEHADGNRVAMKFVPPYELKLLSIGLMMKRSEFWRETRVSL